MYYSQTMEEEIYIEGTNLLPSVTFLREGSMKIEGRIVPDHLTSFFTPLMTWARNLQCSKVVFDIDLEYMNTSASRLLFQLLKSLEENPNLSHIHVFWHYEEEDEEHFETGKILAEKLSRIHFFYKSYVR
jgi:hypothetical protein